VNLFELHSNPETLYGWNKQTVRYHKDNRIWYYLNGKRHRDGGPAFISELANVWYKNGVKHREDGPSGEWKSYDGTRNHSEWCVDGVEVLNIVHQVDGGNVAELTNDSLNPKYRKQLALALASETWRLIRTVKSGVPLSFRQIETLGKTLKIKIKMDDWT
jgi:hypothetical protein